MQSGLTSRGHSLLLPEASPAMAGVVPCGRVLRLFLLLTAGFAAAVLAFIGIARYGFAFEIPAELAPLFRKERLTDEEAVRLDAAFRTREYRNTALQVAIFGAAAGGLLGLAAGAARKSTTAAAAGLLGGTALGMVAGAIGGFADLFLLELLWKQDFEITFKSMAAHSAAFLIAGVGVGIVPGLAARSVLPTLGVVMAAALIAGLAYSGMAAAFFPLPNTNAAVPVVGTGPLLLWTMLPIMLMALGIARVRSPL